MIKLPEINENSSRKEKYLNALAIGDNSNLPTPESRTDEFLKYICENGVNGSMGLNKAIVCVIDDDGTTRSQDEYTGMTSWLNNQGIPMDFAIMSSAVGSDGKLTVAQLKELELVVASNNFSTSIIDTIDFIDSVSTIDENCDIKMVVSNDYGKTWLTTNDNGFTWNELNINSINKPYGSLSVGEVGSWDKFKLGVIEHGFSMKELSTINFNPIKDQVLRFAYVVQVQNKDQVCKVELLNIQFDTHGKIQKLRDDEVDISMDSFNAYVIPSRDMKLMKINMIG